MAKYSQELKLEVVQYSLSGFGSNHIGDKFGIHHSDVDKWVAIYNKHGADGLITKGTKAVYTPEFKYEVIQSVLIQGLSVREATHQYNLKSHTQILSWLLLYEEHGIDGLKAKPKGRPKSVPKPKIKRVKNALNDRDKTQEQLLEELAYLRAENAYLKKRRALIQKQKEQEQAELQRLQDSYLN